MQTYTQGNVPLISEGQCDEEGFDPNQSFCISDKMPDESTDPSSWGASQVRLQQSDSLQHQHFLLPETIQTKRTPATTKQVQRKRGVKHASRIGKKQQDKANLWPSKVNDIDSYGSPRQPPSLDAEHNFASPKEARTASRRNRYQRYWGTVCRKKEIYQQAKYAPSLLQQLGSTPQNLPAQQI
ncbi:uncharacterized protein BKA55DRAFT_681603 [Fusarium redolens]|uniref:Uncharacterized protein n=1 Tax=Fusarium redolens TaxID=48865 RepID=A0A9P9JQ73_FUSRE|nr:uncharacterized protein BKA55DRAFT_681603 [Fusarium redolens]KAH7208436.1 hypothetical protein BKA55DRAFT_681603 [Fusarium redolens]